jgi:hypothetical protein
LTQPEFFLWGLPMGKIYMNKPWSVTTSKKTVTRRLQPFLQTCYV